ncbi:MAG TPA: iron-containing alcohol dehydrogenase [Candidatus Dormibacteraeota bacterium]|nr:iron-containing alcohol dehydrogenase [Candidatus Dormibacteraeota bacterium]
MIQLSQASPARRVLLGAGALAELPAEVDRGGMTKVVLVTSSTLAKSSALVERVESLLAGPHQATFTGVGQHTPQSAVHQLEELLDQTGADGVVSLGGGSVIDGCKAAIHARGAAGITHLAIPTTLSGAEFTASAGVTDDATRRKKGQVDPESAPRRVILDPDATLATPQSLWLSSGIRALDHAVETIWAPERDPLTSFLAKESIRRLLKFLPECQQQPELLECRHGAQIAAWWAALGLASNTMGPSHQLGRVLGATFGIPHGITSCIFLPATIDHFAITEPALVAPLADPLGASRADMVGTVVRAFVESLGLPTALAAAGFDPDDLPRFLELVPLEWHSIVRACV